MTQSFDDWFDENMSKKYSIFDLQSQGARFGFTAGQQSRQAEIDELQKRINKALIELSKVSNMHVINARDILKGKQND